jgi:serine/threonine protein kinase
MNMSFNALKISTNARGGGTTEYGSPDLVINGEMTDFSDIWSLGVILYKIIYKKHPLMTLPSNYSQKLNNFLKGDAKIEYPENERSSKHTAIVEIMKRMLVCSRNKEMRINWA